MAWQNTRRRRLQQWERTLRLRYPDWEAKKAQVFTLRDAGAGIPSISKTLDLTQYLVRSLLSQREGVLLAENRRGKAVSAVAAEKEESWREINRKLSAAVKRLEQGRG